MNLYLKGKNALVLGLGDTGLSCIRWLVRNGARVSVADTRLDPPNANLIKAQMPNIVVSLGPFQESSFANCDLIVASPGVPVSEPNVAAAILRGVPVIGDVELFAMALNETISDVKEGQGTAAKVIAITGSNGKSTVTEMVGAICRETQYRTTVAGNIGLPILDVLLEQDGKLSDIYVLELSSFQLETTHSLNADAATVLNVTEDHLDRYSSMRDYAAAKARVFHGDGTQIINRNDSYSAQMRLPNRKYATFGLDAPGGENDWGMVEIADRKWLAHGKTKLMAADELAVSGLHNAANALAALALCDAIQLNIQSALAALRKFKGLPHRVQWINTINGIAFYDDSKGTNVGATVAALNGLQQKAILIAGGDGKGQDFSPLLPAVAARARAVVLIGRDGKKIKAVLQNSPIPLVEASSMEQAVRKAYELAQPNDVVLLSPACASFDMFRNYEHRAQVFCSAVSSLHREATDDAV